MKFTQILLALGFSAAAHAIGCSGVTDTVSPHYVNGKYTCSGQDADLKTYCNNKGFSGFMGPTEVKKNGEITTCNFYCCDT
ncbi:unnamed protein product [Diplocarpon coronariae]|nr:hypothetical protein JHW43_009105 [Diplocarpon mali]